MCLGRLVCRRGAWAVNNVVIISLTQVCLVFLSPSWLGTHKTQPSLSSLNLKYYLVPNCRTSEKVVTTTQEILLLVLGRVMMEVWQKYCLKLSGNAAFQMGSFYCTVLKSPKSPHRVKEGSISTHPEVWRYITYSYANEFNEDAPIINKKIAARIRPS